MQSCINLLQKGVILHQKALKCAFKYIIARIRFYASTILCFLKLLIYICVLVYTFCAEFGKIKVSMKLGSNTKGYMIMDRNIIDEKPLDNLDSYASSASRIGRRIRRIRVARGLSQAELGSKVGLTADRIQKYENGTRKPKYEMMKKLAIALEVDLSALYDPITMNRVGAMYAFFELEHYLDFRIKKFSEGELLYMCLCTEFSNDMYLYMEEWYNTYKATQDAMASASSQEEKEKILDEYYEWEWNFAQEPFIKVDKRIQKRHLQQQIDKLQQEYAKLDE